MSFIYHSIYTAIQIRQISGKRKKLILVYKKYNRIFLCAVFCAHLFFKTILKSVHTVEDAVRGWPQSFSAHPWSMSLEYIYGLYYRPHRCDLLWCLQGEYRPLRYLCQPNWKSKENNLNSNNEILKTWHSFARSDKNTFYSTLYKLLSFINY